jgi:hypothetical protein
LETTLKVAELGGKTLVKIGQFGSVVVPVPAKKKHSSLTLICR